LRRGGAERAPAGSHYGRGSPHAHTGGSYTNGRTQIDPGANGAAHTCADTEADAQADAQSHAEAGTKGDAEAGTSAQWMPSLL
jgi:hypothetical protein